MKPEEKINYINNILYLTDEEKSEIIKYRPWFELKEEWFQFSEVRIIIDENYDSKIENHCEALSLDKDEFILQLVVQCYFFLMNKKIIRDKLPDYLMSKKTVSVKHLNGIKYQTISLDMNGYDWDKVKTITFDDPEKISDHLI